MAWSDVASIVQTVGMGFVLPIVSAWAASRFKNQTTREIVYAAAQRAGGIAYEYLANRAAGMNPLDARSRAVLEGMKYLEMTIPDAINALHITDETKRGMVMGELGKLLAIDPTVKPNIPGNGNNTTRA